MKAWFPLRVSLPEDDVDLEALVNDMNSSLDSLYSTCSGQQTESTPLLHNGQTAPSHHHTQHIHLRQGQHALVTPEPPASSSPCSDSTQTGVRRSQPMHILAVRYEMHVCGAQRSRLRLIVNYK